MRYRLRTLLIVLALGQPLLAAAWSSYPAVCEWYLHKRIGLAVSVAWDRADDEQPPLLYEMLDDWLPYRLPPATDDRP
jgi:hypothetical protein